MIGKYSIESGGNQNKLGGSTTFKEEESLLLSPPSAVVRFDGSDKKVPSLNIFFGSDVGQWKRAEYFGAFFKSPSNKQSQSITS